MIGADVFARSRCPGAEPCSVEVPCQVCDDTAEWLRAAAKAAVVAAVDTYTASLQRGLNIVIRVLSDTDDATLLHNLSDLTQEFLMDFLRGATALPRRERQKLLDALPPIDRVRLVENLNETSETLAEVGYQFRETAKGPRLVRLRSSCTFAGCTQNARKGSLCAAHAKQWQRNRVLRPLAKPHQWGGVEDGGQWRSCVKCGMEIKTSKHPSGGPRVWAIRTAAGVETPPRSETRTCPGSR